jgi:hypothetical protein
MKTAALLLLSALAASAASEAPAAKATSRTSGRVLKSMVRAEPGPKGPVIAEGRLIILDKAGHTEEFKILPSTKVTLDGKTAAYEKAAVPDAIAAKVVYDPQTKVVETLELKSAPKPKTGAKPAAR